MGDPLGVTASIIAVLQLAAKATIYLKDVKGGASDRTRLRDELRGTVLLLEMLKDRLDDRSQSDTAEPLLIPIEPLAHVNGPLTQFRSLLEDLIARVLPRGGIRGIAQSLAWPFEKKDLQEMLASLERLKSQFILVMQNDLTELAKLSFIKIEGIDTKIDTAQRTSEQEEIDKIIRWISPISFQTKHTSVLDSAQPGTGTWFLQGDKFLAWSRGEVPLLWCPGIPGAGKTTLMSMAIDRMRSSYTKPPTITVFAYCDHGNRQQQTHLPLLSNLMQQALQQTRSEVLPSEIMSLYNRHKKYDTIPTLGEIMDCFKQLVSRLRTFHVIIDALDELAVDPEDAIDFLSTLSSLGPPVKILCTSRNSTSFQTHFKNLGARILVISALDHDLETFLNSRLDQHRNLQRHIKADPSLRDEIIGAVITQSQGIFLSAKLHIENISQKINRRQIRSSLKTLPSSLDEIYHNALERIQSQAPAMVHLAESTLYWIVSAQRLLTVDELRHMYATLDLDPDDDACLEDDDLPDGEILTSVCGGLIAVENETCNVRIIHYTAHDFFQRCHAARISTAKIDLTKACLTYLTLPNFLGGACREDADMLSRLVQYPFLAYAARYWGLHATQVETETLLAFFRKLSVNTDLLEATSQASKVEISRHKDWSQEYARNVPLIVQAASFNAPEILSLLIVNGESVNSHGTDDETAIIRTASLGHVGNVQLLLENQVDINTQDYKGESALLKVCRIGHVGIAKMLLDNGAEINSKADSQLSPLMLAVGSGNIDLVRLLVTQGAKLEATTVWGDSALTVALRNGLETIASYLADQGATLPRGPAARRASVIASRQGLQRLVRRLTADYGAVAGQGLRRESMRPATGLQGIEETTTEEPGDQASDSSTDDEYDPFIEALEIAGQNTGFSQQYVLGKQIGGGSDAIVYTCSHRATSVGYVAKRIQFNKALGRTTPRRLLQRIRAEVKALHSLRHPNIVRLFQQFAEYTSQEFIMVMEPARGGSLFHFIVDKGHLTEDETRLLFSQIFSALGCLHGRGYVHRDVEPENILITRLEPLEIKLINFRLAKEIGKGSNAQVTTPPFMATWYPAPELLASGETKTHGFPVDIWSSGVILYISLCGFPPFSDQLYSESFPFNLIQQIQSARFDYPSPYWDTIGDPALELIDSMLVVDVTQRLDIQQCIDHPWMQDSHGMGKFMPDGHVRSTSPEEINSD